VQASWGAVPLKRKAGLAIETRVSTRSSCGQGEGSKKTDRPTRRKTYKEAKRKLIKHYEKQFHKGRKRIVQPSAFTEKSKVASVKKKGNVREKKKVTIRELKNTEKSEGWYNREGPLTVKYYQHSPSCKRVSVNGNGL